MMMEVDCGVPIGTFVGCMKASTQIKIQTVQDFTTAVCDSKVKIESNFELTSRALFLPSIHFLYPPHSWFTLIPWQTNLQSSPTPSDNATSVDSYMDLSALLVVGMMTLDIYPISHMIRTPYRCFPRSLQFPLKTFHKSPNIARNSFLMILHLLPYNKSFNLPLSLFSPSTIQLPIQFPSTTRNANSLYLPPHHMSRRSNPSNETQWARPNYHKRGYMSCFTFLRVFTVLLVRRTRERLCFLYTHWLNNDRTQKIRRGPFHARQTLCSENSRLLQQLE
jgi:hypothetical protein